MTRERFERDIAIDLAKHGLQLAPLVLVPSLVFAGLSGLASSAFAIAIVLVNFRLSAAILGWASGQGPGVMMSAALSGYVLRLALVTVAVVAVHEQSWVAMLPLGLTLIATHLGLLFWEARYVSLTLAYPGLKPRQGV